MTYLRMQELLARLPVSETTIKRWVKAKKFPQPVKLGERVTGFKTSDVEAWEREKEQNESPRTWA